MITEQILAAHDRLSSADSPDDLESPSSLLNSSALLEAVMDDKTEEEILTESDPAEENLFLRQLLIIQRNVRKWIAQKQYNTVKTAISCLQAAYRGHTVRKEYHKLQKIRLLQRHVRVWLSDRHAVINPTNDDEDSETETDVDVDDVNATVNQITSPGTAGGESVSGTATPPSQRSVGGKKSPGELRDTLRRACEQVMANISQQNSNCNSGSQNATPTTALTPQQSGEAGALTFDSSPSNSTLKQDSDDATEPNVHHSLLQAGLMSETEYALRIQRNVRKWLRKRHKTPWAGCNNADDDTQDGCTAPTQEEKDSLHTYTQQLDDQLEHVLKIRENVQKGLTGREGQSANDVLNRILVIQRNVRVWLDARHQQEQDSNEVTQAAQSSHFNRISN
eukprot:TRINITY_DN56878_c0_g2_i1.p1 TRINITY_DN56878_c0_g2~~TRINITY_DN56878_c0_g2_i1.p1  ORF type:complete len:417 (-),score=41.52 TRINITY_DN56878_c0_g2_i1:79-1257(-)